jgi:hypothetical protein
VQPAGDHAESLDSVPEAQKLKEKPPGKNDSKPIRRKPVHAQLVLPEKKRLEDVVEEPVSLYTQPTPLRRKRWSIPSLRWNLRCGIITCCVALIFLLVVILCLVLLAPQSGYVANEMYLNNSILLVTTKD